MLILTIPSDLVVVNKAPLARFIAGFLDKRQRNAQIDRNVSIITRKYGHIPGVTERAQMAGRLTKRGDESPAGYDMTYFCDCRDHQSGELGENGAPWVDSLGFMCCHAWQSWIEYFLESEVS